MPYNDILTLISLVTGIASIMLAIVAMIYSRNAENKSQENFDRTKDILHEIDIKSAVINENVQKNLTQLTTLFKNLLDKVIKNPSSDGHENIDKKGGDLSKDSKQNMIDQAALQLLPELIKNPDNLSRLFELSEKLKNK